MKDVEAPIIPVALDGVWGSIFSFDKGRFLWKLPRRIPYPRHGQLRPADAAHGDALRGARSACRNCSLKPGSIARRACGRCTAAFVRTARRHPFRFAMADATTPKVTLRLGAGANGLPRAALAESLGRAGDGRAAAAAVGAGRAGELRRGAAGQSAGESELHRVRGNARLLHQRNARSKPSSPRRRSGQAQAEGAVPKLSCSEEVGGQTAASARSSPPICSCALARCRDSLCLAAAAGRGEERTRLDDLATVIFSSGSTGEPKGVMLSHYNIGSNIEQIEQVFGLNRRGRLSWASCRSSIRLASPARSACRRCWAWAWCIIPIRSTPKPSARWSRPTRAHLPAGHADVPATLHARLLGGGFRQPARGDDRRGKIARPAGRRVRGTFRHPPARRLRLHRMRAGGGGQHAGFPLGRLPAGRRQARQNRPSAARRERAHRRPGRSVERQTAASASPA